VANGYLNGAAFTPVPYFYYPNTPPHQCGTGILTDPDPSGNTCVVGFGDLGRNIYRGPFQQNWDVSFLKHFKIGERQDIRFAADFFNLWNHTNFADPSVTDIETYSPGGGSPFGKILGTTGNPRLIQFSLRWAF
jgi:hypothetical protein